METLIEIAAGWFLIAVLGAILFTAFIGFTDREDD